MSLSCRNICLILICLFSFISCKTTPVVKTVGIETYNPKSLDETHVKNFLLAYQEDYNKHNIVGLMNKYTDNTEILIPDSNSSKNKNELPSILKKRKQETPNLYFDIPDIKFGYKQFCPDKKYPKIADLISAEALVNVKVIDLKIHYEMYLKRDSDEVGYCGDWKIVKEAFKKF